MRQSIHALVAQRFAAVHAATTCAEFPHYCTLGDAHGLRAALGYRFAAEGPLFLEQYLEHAVEQHLAGLLGQPVDRAAIVEIGAHASLQPRATVALWVQAASELDGLAELAVAVLTAPMRAMFARLSVPFLVLARADRSRLGNCGAEWGRYYEADPMVCVGVIGAARAPLSRWQTLVAQ